MLETDHPQHLSFDPKCRAPSPSGLDLLLTSFPVRNPILFPFFSARPSFQARAQRESETLLPHAAIGICWFAYYAPGSPPPFTTFFCSRWQPSFLPSFTFFLAGPVRSLGYVCSPRKRLVRSLPPFLQSYRNARLRRYAPHFHKPNSSFLNLTRARIRGLPQFLRLRPIFSWMIFPFRVVFSACFVPARLTLLEISPVRLGVLS